LNISNTIISRIVKEYFLKREIIKFASTSLENAYSDSDVFETLELLQSNILKVKSDIISNFYMTPKELANYTIDIINKTIAGEIRPIKSYFADLNKIIIGYFDSDLIYIGARPSIGKTAFAFRECEYIAFDLGLPVAFFSLEMNKLQLMYRSISGATRIGLQEIRQANYTQSQLERVKNYLVKYSKSQLIIEDPAFITAEGIYSRAVILKEKYDIRLLAIDYLQLVGSSNPKDDDYVRAGKTSVILKQLAKAINIPVMAPVQLNRKAEERKYHTPQLADLRSNGQLEQDADIVILLDRPEQYGEPKFSDGDSSEGKARAIIAKARNSPTGSIKIAYLKDFARFDNLESHLVAPDDLNYIPDDNLPF